MNQELEKQVPVVEQVAEIEQTEEAISSSYSLNPDGTIEKDENSNSCG
jgi:hypothetical protein